MNATPRLEGLGIVLRPLALSDAPALFVALGDPEVQIYRRAAAHVDVAETKQYIGDTLRRSRAAWAITENGGDALGRLALRAEGETGEFGIVIRRSAQRKGLGLKALQLAQAHAFGDLGLTRLFADIDTENAASIALFTRAGFAREALLREHRTTKLGLRDSVILAKSAPPR